MNIPSLLLNLYYTQALRSLGGVPGLVKSDLDPLLRRLDTADNGRVSLPALMRWAERKFLPASAVENAVSNQQGASHQGVTDETWGARLDLFEQRELEFPFDGTHPRNPFGRRLCLRPRVSTTASLEAKCSEMLKATLTFPPDYIEHSAWENLSTTFGRLTTRPSNTHCESHLPLF